MTSAILGATKHEATGGCNNGVPGINRGKRKIRKWGLIWGQRYFISQEQAIHYMWQRNYKKGFPKPG